ncbi:acetaldehyde dehydrogenase [Klebsiella pneumoniae]|nr:acetaldehyde dehydrogenase [Klebsiella pneumoniae]
MIELDNDLQSRQNARELVRNAKKAQAMLATFSQQQIDAIVKNVAQEAAHHAEALAKMAAEETGFGNWQDKVRLAARLRRHQRYEDRWHHS